MFPVRDLFLFFPFPLLVSYSHFLRLPFLLFRSCAFWCAKWTVLRVQGSCGLGVTLGVSDRCSFFSFCVLLLYFLIAGVWAVGGGWVGLSVRSMVGEYFFCFYPFSGSSGIR